MLGLVAALLMAIGGFIAWMGDTASDSIAGGAFLILGSLMLGYVTLRKMGKVGHG